MKKVLTLVSLLLLAASVSLAADVEEVRHVSDTCSATPNQ
jgi:hypothetical protein